MNIANTNASHKITLGNRIKQSPVKEMRDTIWAETSKAVNDEPWYITRHTVIIPIQRLVIASNDLIILLWN